MNDKNKLQPTSGNQLQEEEVDLGNLFKVIGKGIKNFFNFLGDILQSIFHYFILFLIFIKNNLLKLGLALVLGFIVGLFLHYLNPKSFVSEMIVETNYGSGMQLYKQIDYLNDLVKKKDSVSLSNVLSIHENEASKISNFKVSPYQPSQNLYNAYDEYLLKTDTVYTRNYKFEDFKKRMNNYDLRYHQIEVSSESSNMFTKLSTSLIYLVESDYYKNKRDIKINEINQKLSILNKNLIQVDSLRKTYKEVSLKEAEKLSSSSTIEISKSEKEKDENDIKLFQTSNEILYSISETNQDLIRKNNVINIISDFDKVGVPDKKLFHKKYIQFPLLFLALMLGWILLSQLNRFIDNYSKKNNYTK